MGVVEELRRIVILLAAIYGTMAVLLFLEKQGEEASRFVLFAGFFISVLLVPLVRMFVKKMLVEWEVWGIPTVIYGDVETTSRVIRAFKENKGFGYVPVGVFNHQPDSVLAEIEGVPVLGDIKHATASAPIAIIASPGRAPAR